MIICFGFLLFLRHLEQSLFIGTQYGLKSYIIVLSLINWEACAQQPLKLLMLLSYCHLLEYFPPLDLEFSILIISIIGEISCSLKWTIFFLKLLVYTFKLLVHICTIALRQTYKDDYYNIICKSRNWKILNTHQ